MKQDYTDHMIVPGPALNFAQSLLNNMKTGFDLKTIR
jgi:hypothetical protein